MVARFDTITVSEDGADRVRVSGARGEPAPEDLKVCINYVGGHRNSMTFVLNGLDIERKAEVALRLLWDRLGDPSQFAECDVRLIRADHEDATTIEGASAFLRVTVKDPDGDKVGRRFSNAVTELALASYPGFTMTSPPSDGTVYGVYWPALVPADVVEHRVVLPDGSSIVVPHSKPTPGTEVVAARAPEALTTDGPTARAPLGRLFGARSGDKGGNANLGVWARDARAFAWLAREMTVERIKDLIPEAAELVVQRYDLPNLWALNFVLVGFLGEGVSSSTRFDPQAKALGEFWRSRVVDLPVSLLDAENVRDVQPRNGT